MTGPVITQLAATTVNRKWILEVDTGTGSPTWTYVEGVTNFQPVTDDANWVDDSDFASGGFQSQTKTSAAWSATCTVRRAAQVDDPSAYGVGQEFLRTHAEGKFGPDNQVSVRFYEYDPEGGLRIQAYTGKCGVGWAEQGGEYNALSTVQVTLTGQGQLNTIDHPYPDDSSS